MILLDLHQTVIASAFALFKLGAKPDEKLLRHTVLNSIRASRLKFKNDYGEMVICADSRNYWRKVVFPFYKANRKPAQAKSPIDWQVLFVTMDKLKTEFKDNLPYRFIQIDGVEADDIISTLAKDAAAQGEKVMIVSADHDFVQLQANPSISQWNPIKKKPVIEKNPQRALLEKIVTGDTGDGIPNILSDDDALVDPNKRQKPMTKKRIEALDLDNFNRDTLSPLERRGFDRNMHLIDFSYIPDSVIDDVRSAYEIAEIPSRKALKAYFFSNSLGKLFSNIGDF